MTTYREDRPADVRDYEAPGTMQAPSAGPSWQGEQVAPSSQSDGEPLMRAVLDLVRDLDEQVSHLKAALHSNRRIGIAMGIVMSQFRITDQDAFAALRQASQNSNRKLREVAEDVIYAGHLTVDG